MDRQQAQDLVASYMIDQRVAIAQHSVTRIADAFIILKIPIPPALGQEIAANLQQKIPDGYTAIAEPYLGRWRMVVVKNEHVKRWADRPPEEHD